MRGTRRWVCGQSGGRDGGVRVLDSAARPHLGNATIWVRYPPYGPRTEWTNDHNMAMADPKGKLYLPFVLMHEFGHAAGLTHYPTGVMGPYVVGDPLQQLQDSDKQADAGILAAHTD